MLFVKKDGTDDDAIQESYILGKGARALIAEEVEVRLMRMGYTIDDERSAIAADMKFMRDLRKKDGLGDDLRFIRKFRLFVSSTASKVWGLTLVALFGSVCAYLGRLI